MAKGIKTGGRQKGTPNKSTASFRQTLESLGFDIAAEAVTLYRHTDTPLNTKMQILNLLTEYSQSKPKPTEELPPDPSPNPDEPTEKPNLTVITNDRLTELLKKPHGPDAS